MTIANKQKNQPARSFLSWLFALFNPLFLLGYGFTTVLTPRLGAFDSAGTKFLALAILNLVAFFFLLLRKEQRPPNKIFSAFFSNRIGFLYGLFLVVNLLSFLKAVNLAESLLAFTKLFTVLTAAMIIAAILRANNKYVTPLAIGMSLLLLADAANVFSQMWQLVEKHPNFADLFSTLQNEIKHGYSNKNILSSALFVKLPFALWLWTFKKGLAKILGLFAAFAGIMALFPLSSRAFYIGLALLTVFYLLFIIIRIFIDRHRGKMAMVSVIIIALIPLFIYVGWLVLSHYLPSVKTFNLKDNITARLSTIKNDEAIGLRTASWRRSLKLIKEEPLLGVGAGNWKISILKYENQTAPDYTYYYYNHNDFIQTTAETGIIGGLLFLLLFIGVGWAFLIALFKGAASGASYEYLFIPAFGMLCYSVDAFFNFPFDRPEIQSLFAIFIGSGIAFSSMKALLKKLREIQQKILNAIQFPTDIINQQFKRILTYLLPGMFILLIIGSIYLLYRNFKSLQLEAVAKYEVEKGVLTVPSSVFMKGFYSIPNISVEGVPIMTLKTRYLFNEGNYAGAIRVLKAENPSPWETRRELFLSFAYEMIANSDSSIHYSIKVFNMKPFYLPNLDRLCKMLEEREQFKKEDSILTEFIRISGSSPQQYIDLQREVHRKATIQKVEQFYYPAMNQFKQKNYRGAAGDFSKIIETEPGLLEAWEKRAWCYFYLNEPKLCLADIDHLIGQGVKKPELVNLKTKLAK